MKHNRYAAIILAAGFSQRMQSFKPLLPVGDETITDRLVSVFQQNEVEVSLVVGYKGNDLRAGLQSRDIQIVENANFQEGMFTSIQAGLRGLQSAYRGVFIMPVDIPLVRPHTIRSLLSLSAECPDKILYPVFSQRRGHPPLVPFHLVPLILNWHENGGLKSFLQSHNSDSCEVEVPDSNILFDIDSPEDYKMLLERYQQIDVPTAEECDVIIQKIHPLTQPIYKHCLKVAEVAITISRTLTSTGQNVNSDLIYAAAILHDIAKGQARHESTGALIVRDLGFGKVAEIIAVHTDFPEENQRPSLESKIVYLSDKLVNEDVLVSVENRYRKALARFGNNSAAMAAILKRQERTLEVKAEIEKLLSCSLDKLISS